MKKLISALLCLLFVFSLAACGKKTASEEPAEDAYGSRFAAFYEKYLKDGEYTMRISSSGQDVSVAVSGGRVYLAPIADDAGYAFLMTDDSVYLINFSLKAAIKYRRDAEDLTDDPFKGASPADSFLSATGEIGGKELYFEEYSDEEEGETVAYYFDGGDLKYIVKNYDMQNSVALLEIEKGADASLFSVPEGYTLTEGGGISDLIDLDS